MSSSSASPNIDLVSSPSNLKEHYDILILDTNVLLSYPALIPNPNHPALLESPSIELNHKHLVISSIIFEELDRLKSQHISISVSARTVLRRLEDLFSFALDFVQSFNLKNNLHIHGTSSTGKDFDFLIGFWNVPNDISCYPFIPRSDHSDGKIVASALTVRDTAWVKECSVAPKVTILSNDYALRFLARTLGVMALPFDLGEPDMYSGRRAVNAPRILYAKLIREHSIPGKLWRQYMPSEPPLYPNEFIVFCTPTPKKQSQNPSKARSKRKHGRPIKPSANPSAQKKTLPIEPKSPSERFNFIGRYDVELDEIVSLAYLDRSPIEPNNIGQAIHVEAMMNPKIGVVIVDNTPHYRSNHVAVVTYRTREPAFTDDIYDKFHF